MTTANPTLRDAHASVLATLNKAAAQAGLPVPQLLAVSKTRTVDEVAQLHSCGQRAFGENYVQEAAVKAEALAGRGLEWHLIGPLQSNKCREAAEHFDWLQSLDRLKLVAPLARHRPPARTPLNVLVQVNVDDEASKSGCRPDEVGMRRL